MLLNTDGADFVALAARDGETLAERALLAAGATPATARCVARHVTDAELAGHPSHGLRLVANYCAAAGSEGCRLDREPTLERLSNGVTLVDAHAGLGFLALELAIDATAEAARRQGIAACGVIRCGHAGRAGGWVERGAAKGMVTFVLLGGSTPPFAMAAAPGTKPALHTNPIAIGMPAEGPTFMLDIATSRVAEGKVAIARSRGTELPQGSILGPDGLPTNDPDAFYAGGALLPFAAHKGFGLSAMIEVLAVALTGADADGRAPVEGALVISVDAEVFRPMSEVWASVEAVRARLHASGIDREVLAPGEPEATQRLATTIRVERELHATLESIASRTR